LKLDQLVDEALKNNPEILAAKKKWEVYREKVPQAFALGGSYVRAWNHQPPHQFQF
jgi:hypothetical protein